MKSIYSTVVPLAAVLLASLSASTTEAWSSTTAVHQKVIHPNKNARIIATPHKVMSTVPTRSTIPLSAATTSNSFSSNTMNSAASSTTLGAKAKRMIANLLRIRTILLHQFSSTTVLLTHKFKVVMLSTMLAITTLLPPKCAVAKSHLFSLSSSSAKDTSSSSIVAPSSTSSSGMKKVGKVVVTIGAVGAGASTANAMRGKFACSDDNEKEEEGGEDDDEESAPVNGKKEKESPTTNGSSRQPTATTTKNNGAVNKNNNKVGIEPLSEEWIQQQLNDAEKRSNVLNDAIKMTQQSVPPSPSVVTKPSTTKVNGSKKKMSVGNTIGIPSTNKSTQPPLVKNLDSKIQMLQQRDAERTKQQQRIHEEQAQVELEARQVAIVEAKQKIEAAEREYRKSQQLQQEQQQQEVEQSVVAVKEVEVDATPTSTAAVATTSSRRLAIKIGPEGTPAKSKEEDLELTTQVILEYVNSIDGKSGGVVDDDDE